jgi:hypothetical protein
VTFLLCHETKTFLLLFSPSVLINARYARRYQLYGGYAERREHDDGYDFVWLPQKWRKRVMGEDPMRKGPG